MSLVIPIIFAPLRYSLPIVIFLSSIIPASVNYASTTFSFRKGTLYQNLTLTKNNKYNYYISSALTFGIIVIVCNLILLISLASLANLSLLISGWAWQGHGNSGAYEIANIKWLAYYYSLFELTLVMFVVLFFFQAIFNDERSLHIFILALAILAIIYGGLFNAYFWNKTSIDSTIVNGAQYVYFKPASFGSWLYVPSMLLLPFFGPLQHLTCQHFSIVGYSNYQNLVFFTWQKSSWSLNGGILGTRRAMSWNILWFMPYIHTFVFVSGSILISKIKRR